MQYRTYGNTGIKVSALGFGAMRLPRDHDESVALLRRGMDLGINFLDTAMGYLGGESEIMVGKAVKGRRDQVYLSTKNACSEWTNESWRQRLEQSLTKLDTDYLDFYCIVHGMTWDNFVNRFSVAGGGLEAAYQAKEEGLIRHLCMSCHDTPDNMLKLIDTGVFEGMILQYNLLDRANEDVLAHAHDRGLGVCIMGPVGGGRLAHPSERLAGVLGGGLSTPEIALRFVLANPHVTCALSGMNALQQVEENCATASREEPLTAEELEALRVATEENARLADLYCTGCGYCLPCPNNVAIPEIFKAMNYHRVWGLTDLARRMYGRLGNERHPEELNALACTECGQCEEKCPQNLHIIEQLKESHAALGEKS
ncbi:MAG: aldo/keto reductase [candidate division WS1 bacterium]|jgi:predicted aldo/keto reductase-like oxidoreductase|nr:aldo/keto reductase [candidate division WS1 bacterium]